MKLKVYSSQLLTYEIDYWDFEGNKYEIPEDLNEFGLYDFDNEEFLEEEKDSINPELDTIKLNYIDQFYYGGGAMQPNKDKKLHLELIIDCNDKYDKDELLWLVNEIMYDLWDNSPKIHGVDFDFEINKAKIDKIEEVK